MKKIIFSIVFLAMLASCGGNKQHVVAEKDQASNNEHNWRNSLDYKGVYRGTLPTDDGEGVEVTLFIEDSTYSKSVSYVGKMSAAVMEEGRFTWNAEGTTITLLGETMVGPEMPRQYLVGENTLLQLDAKGKKNKGKKADQYTLIKDQ